MSRWRPACGRPLFAYCLTALLVLVLMISLEIFFSAPDVLEAGAVRESVPLSDAERAWIARHPVLRIAIDPYWYPLEYVEDGVHRGLTAAYLEAIGRATGLAFETVAATDWDSALSQLDSGDIHLASGVSAKLAPDAMLTPVLLSDAYYAGVTVLVRRLEDRATGDLAHLSGSLIGVKAGGAYERWIRNHYPAIHPISFSTSRAALKALANGEIQGVVGLGISLIPYVRRGYGNVMGVAGELTDMPVVLAMGVSKQHPQLLPIIDKVLASLSVGQVEAMYAKEIETASFGAPSWQLIVEYYSEYIFALCIGLLIMALFVQRTRAAARYAIRGEAEKSRFLAVLSHEIRTPLSAISSSVELLSKTRLSPRQQGLAVAAGRGAEHLLGWLDNVLNMSRLEAGRTSLALVPTDIGLLLHEAAAAVQASASQKGLFIDVQLDVGDCDVAVDPYRLRQILLNLLSNAVKFTEQGGVVMRAALTAWPGVVGGRDALLCLSVEDSGIGIAPQRQADLFQAFSQLDDAITRQYGGTGLGLSICKELLELMQGTITLHSVVGLGSRFDISIPVTQHERAAAAARPVRGQAAAPFVTVMVMEDDATNRHLIREQLCELGYGAVLYNSGEAGLRALKAAAVQPDIILLDYQLSGINGCVVAQAVRRWEQEQERRHTPIVAISATLDPGFRRQCLDSGMDDVLGKPLRLDALASMLQRWNPKPATGRQALPQDGSTAQLRDIYATSLGSDVAALLKAVETQDREAAIYYSHRIKGASAAVSELDIADCASSLEQFFLTHGLGKPEQLEEELRRFTQVMDGAGL